MAEWIVESLPAMAFGIPLAKKIGLEKAVIVCNLSNSNDISEIYDQYKKFPFIDPNIFYNYIGELIDEGYIKHDRDQPAHTPPVAQYPGTLDKEA